MSVTVGKDGAWFSIDGGPRVDLSKRRVLRSLLLFLVREHATEGGAAQPSRALVEALWPDERMDPRSGRNRVYVAMSTLRSLGLSPALVRRPEGYLIDPTVSIQSVSEL